MPIGPGNVHFTYAQLEGIWEQAGGSPQAAPMAAAIAMAESGGNSAAYLVDSNGSIDRGLWQINSVHGAQSTFDIMGNARSAVAISNNGTNWRPWTTYNSGAYRQFLQGNVPAQNNVPINGTNAAANQPATVGSTSGAQQSQTQTTASGWSCLLPTNWLSCAAGAAGSAAGSIFSDIVTNILSPIIEAIIGIIGMTSGGTLMLIGMFLIFESTKTGQQVTQGGMQVASMFAGPEAGAATAGAAQRQPRTFYSTTPSGVRQRTTSYRVDGQTYSTREQLVAQANEYGGHEYIWRPIPHRQPRGA